MTDYEMNKGWAQTTLGTVTKHRSGNGQLIKGKIYQEPGPGRIPAYSASGQDVWCDQADYSGDGVVVSAVGARCGKSFRASGQWTAIANTHVVQPVPGAVDPVFLWYLLNDESFWVKSGTAQPFVVVRKTFERVFFMPPRREQDRIVAALDERLSELDASVASLERAERNLVRYRAAVLAAACSGTLVPTEADLARRAGRSYEPADQLLARILVERRAANTKAKYEEPAQPDTSRLPKLPDGWVWATMDHLLARIETGTSFSCDERPPVEDEIGVVKVSAVTWGTYDENASKTCMDPDRVDLSTLVRTGDFLFSRANTIELIGACVIAERVTKKIMLSDKILRFCFAGADRRWVLLCLRSAFGRKAIQALSTGNQMSMRNIGQDRIRAIPMPMPPEAEQARIVAEVDRHLSRADALAAAIAQSKRRAQRLRRAILAAAFQGRLVPQDPHDEPASVLLERIRAEVAAAPAPAPRRGRPPASARAAEATTIYDTPAPKRRGRPPGSKNKATA